MGGNPRLPVDALLERRPEATHPEPAEGVIQLHERRLERQRREEGRLVEQFIRAYSDKLRRLAARLVGVAHADDVTQDAFENFTKKLGTDPAFQALLHSQEELFRLMRTITSRRAYDKLRRNRRQVSMSDHQEATDIPDEAPLCDGVPARVAVARVAQAYDALPPAQRVAHVLRYYYDYSHDQIAETLMISESTSRRLVFLANHALRKAMEMDP
jgi:RNA polymerase sigma factor (sigma-70 family)